MCGPEAGAVLSTVLLFRACSQLLLSFKFSDKFPYTLEAKRKISWGLAATPTAAKTKAHLYQMGTVNLMESPEATIVLATKRSAVIRFLTRSLDGAEERARPPSSDS